MEIPIDVKKELFQLNPEDWLRYRSLSRKEELTEEELEECLKFVARDEGSGGEFLDNEEFHK